MLLFYLECFWICRFSHRQFFMFFLEFFSFFWSFLWLSGLNWKFCWGFLVLSKNRHSKGFFELFCWCEADLRLLWWCVADVRLFCSCGAVLLMWSCCAHVRLFYEIETVMSICNYFANVRLFYRIDTVLSNWGFLITGLCEGKKSLVGYSFSIPSKLHFIISLWITEPF